MKIKSSDTYSKNKQDFAGCDNLVRYRVLFHLDEGSTFRLKLTLDNIRNLYTDLGETNVRVECVVNGAGVKLFQTHSSAEVEVIQTLITRGVRFVICTNSLAGNDISQNALINGVMFVPSGVGELVKKQAEGWAYIKP